MLTTTAPVYSGLADVVNRMIIGAKVQYHKTNAEFLVLLQQ